MFLHFHPHKPFLYKGVQKIIMGTLPPPRFCDKEKLKKEDVYFPYGSKDNLLWPVLDKIFKLNLLYDNTQTAINQRKEFCHCINLGICDIVESCKREKIDASDIGMKEAEFRPILKYLDEFDTIDTIIFTGGASKNGPEYFLRQILKKENIKLKSISKELPKMHSFIYKNREITTISLTSPSNAANRFIGSNTYYKEQKVLNPKYSTFDFRYEQYKKVFN